MFTCVNPVDHYIKEIRVASRTESVENRTVSLPFVMDSQPSSRSVSPSRPSAPAMIYPFSKRQVPAIKRQLHREIVYYFGIDQKFTRDEKSRKYYRDTPSAGMNVSCDDEACRQLFRSSVQRPRQRILLKKLSVERTKTFT